MSKPIKVIFLDFDGVLNNLEHYTARPPVTPNMSWDDRKDRNIHKPAVQRLNRIVQATGAVVVVSSMWRFATPIAELRSILNRNGFTGKTLSKTAEDWRRRGSQVRDWLHKPRAFAIESFVIIDDEDDFEDFGRDRLVQTSFQGGGLLDEHIEPAVKMLEKPWTR